MMKKILMLLLLVCLVLPIVVFAGPPEEVEGYFYYTPTGCEDEKWANDNYIGRECHDTGVYGTGLDGFSTAGDFHGTSIEVYELVLHGANPEADDPIFDEYKMGWYKGLVEFEGTVGDSSEGTMWIQYIGKSPGNMFWSGTWRILGGVDGLVGIHGGGTWGPSTDLNYFVHLEGQIHFTPH
jgi:hypothetical protein